MTKQSRIIQSALAICMTFASSLASATIAIECTSTTSAQSGSGQQFNIISTLRLAFSSPTSASLKYYTNAGNGNQLDDGGVVKTTGEKYDAEPGYVIFKGTDRVEQGFLYVALPEDPTSQDSGFDAYFMTTETDLGTSKPVKFSLGAMTCTKK